METIDPRGGNESLHYSRLGENRQSNSSRAARNPIASGTSKPSRASSAYADLFDDKELERLQRNLQTVSDLASQALEQLKTNR